MLRTKKPNVSHKIFMSRLFRRVVGVERISGPARNSVDPLREMARELVRKSGVTTGITCGDLKSTDVTSKSGGITLRNQRAAAYVSAPGDSGAAVYKARGGRSAIAVGTHRGKQNRFLEQDRRLYSHVSYLQRDLAGFVIGRRGRCGAAR